MTTECARWEQVLQVLRLTLNYLRESERKTDKKVHGPVNSEPTITIDLSALVTIETRGPSTSKPNSLINEASA